MGGSTKVRATLSFGRVILEAWQENEGFTLQHINHVHLVYEKSSEIKYLYHVDFVENMITLGKVYIINVSPNIGGTWR